MKRVLSILLTALVLTATPSAAHADEDDKTQLEFVHRLRERHQPQLALEYLEKLKKTGSPSLVKMIPVEIARTEILMARELDATQGKKLFEKARQGLEAYAKANAGTPAAAQARLEMARLATYEAQALLSQAQRQDDAASKYNKARQAENKFKQAGAALEDAYKALPAADQLKVKFEKAKNLLDQAQSIDRFNSKPEDTRRRRDLIDAAKKSLETIEKEAGKDEQAESLHLARAWLFMVNRGESLDADAAKKYLKKVLNTEEPAAAAARRLVQSYLIKNYDTDPDAKEGGVARLQTVQRLAQQWLKTNRSFRNTPEGYGVRFAQASAWLFESKEIEKGPKFTKDKKKQLAAKKLKADALKAFTELAATDNDFQKAANRRLIALSIERIGNQRVGSLVNADDCFLKAQYELSLMQETAALAAKTTDGVKRGELEKERAGHEADVIEAYQRGIKLAKEAPSLKDRLKKVSEAQYFLAYFYMKQGATTDAAKLGEEAARNDAAQTKFSPLTAGFAIDAYLRLMNDEKQASQARKKLMDLADFIVKKRQTAWQGEPILQIALYQHALACLREKNDVQLEIPAEKYQREIQLIWQAIELFGKLSPEFRGYEIGQCQKAFAALLGMKHVDKNTERDPKKAKKEILAARAKERAAFQDVFLKTMKALKPVGPNTDPATVQLYFQAKIEEGNLVFAGAKTFFQQENFPGAVRKFTDLSDLMNRLKKEFALASNKLDAGMRAGVAQAIAALDNRARLGLGNIDYQAGDFAKVLSPAITAPVVEGTRKLAREFDAKAVTLRKEHESLKAASVSDKNAREKMEVFERDVLPDIEPVVWIKVEDHRVLTGLLGLALRANVQLGKVSNAMEVLGLLRRVRAEQGAVDVSGDELETLIRELKNQIRDLRNNKTKLAATVKNYTLFLQELAKVKGPNAGSTEDQLFLGNFYSSLGNYKEAAKYFEKMQRPMVDKKKKLDKLDKKEAEKLSQYFVMQVQYGRALRLDKQLPEAKKVLEGVVNDPQSTAKFLAHKELAHVEEDAKRFVNAVNAWGKFLKNKSLEAALNDSGKTVKEHEQLKKLYFEGWYHSTYSIYMLGKNYKVTDKKTQEKKDFYIKHAAENIHKLESAPNRKNWEIVRPLFLELIESEPLLRAQPNMREILAKYTKK